MGVEPKRKRLVAVHGTLRHAPYGELRSMYVDVDVDIEVAGVDAVGARDVRLR